jgi:exosome complex component CSL4
MKKKLVFPGQALATAEEFSPGKNAFEDESGEVKAASVGQSEFKSEEREVDVAKKGRNVLPLKRGDTVYGGVVMVKNDFVIIEIFKAEWNGTPKVFNDSRAVLVIRNASRGYVESMNELFKLGDILKAEVTQVTKYSTEISTEQGPFGVIKAFCSKCKQPLQMFQEQLKCTGCGNVESRKVSQDYILR